MNYEYDKPTRYIYGLDELKRAVSEYLGDCSVQDRDDAIAILKQNGYIFEPIIEIKGVVRHDNIFDFWPDNMLF